MPEEALVTAEFVLRMDEIFDSVNGCSFKDLKPNRRPLTRTSYHVAFWNESVEWLRAIKFVGSKARIYCVDGWQLTLTAMQLLWQDVEKISAVKFMVPRRLNQDCLESYFASIRQKGGFRDNPSCSHFRGTMRQCVANRLLSSYSGGNTVAITTDDSILLSLSALNRPDDKSTSDVLPVCGLRENEEAVVSTTLINVSPTVDLASLNALTYVAGYVIFKTQCYHKCTQCSELLCKNGELGDNGLTFMHLKAICQGDFGKLTIPSDEVVRYLGAVESEFLKALPKYVHSRRVLATINEVIGKTCSSTLKVDLCQGVLDKICQLYLRVRIHAELPAYLSELVADKSHKVKKRIVNLPSYSTFDM